MEPTLVQSNESAKSRSRADESHHGDVSTRAIAKNRGADEI